MKNLKAILLGSVLAFASVTTLVTSCTEDKCKSVVCNNGGACGAETGLCTCKSGFEGATCSTLSRAKFLNAAGYQVVEDGTNSASSTYAVTIAAAGTDSVSVNISNVWGLFTNTVKATISGSTIAIARQQPDNDGYWVEGNGTLTGNVISMKYKVTNEIVPAAIVTDDFGFATGSASTWTKK
jgi:hypothetical protein